MSVLRVLAVFGIVAVAATSAHARMSWTCEELNARWPVYHRDLKIAWPLGHFECPSSASALVEAIALIHDVKFRGNTDGYSPGLYDWLGRTVRAIDYADESTSGAVTHYHGQSVVTLMNPFFKLPLFQRAAVLVHEARHAMYPAEPGHVTCAGGSEAGKEGHCDAEFHRTNWEGSGYSWGFVFMWHLADDTDAVLEDHDAIIRLLKWELNNRYNYVSAADRAYFQQQWHWDGH